MAIAMLAGSHSADAFIEASYFSGRLDATYAGGGQYRVWTVREQNGGITSRRDAPLASGGSLWLNHGAGFSASKPQGPAATSYVSGPLGTDTHEIVVYVGQGSELNIGQVINGGLISWRFVDPPQDPFFHPYELGGNVATTTFLASGHRYLLVGATTTDGHLFRFVGDADDEFVGGWTDSSSSLTWLADTSLAATTSPDGSIASIFATHSPGNESLGVVRFGQGWSTVNLGHPFARQTCRSIAVGQGEMTPGMKRVVVACVPYSAVPELHVAVANDFGSFNFTWTIESRPTGTLYQSVAVVMRPKPAPKPRSARPPVPPINPTNEFDIYLSSLNESRIDKGTYTKDDLLVMLNLGEPPESGVLFGGIAAVPYGSSSRLFFVADQNGRNALYERYGGDVSAAPQNYRAYGDSDFNAFGYGDFFAEGKVAVWRGTMAASVIQRPDGSGGSDWPQIYFLYSSGEGKTLFAPQQVTNVVDGTTFNYVSDPTTVVTDLRTMYSFQIGVNFGDNDTCAGSDLEQVSDNVIYLVSTTPQSFPNFTAPQVLDRRAGSRIALDHPYADIQHRDGIADIIHVAWWDAENSLVRYCPVYEGSTWFGDECPGVVNLVNPSPMSMGGPPRVTASDSGRAIVYFGEYTDNRHGTVYICEINSTLDGCVGGKFQAISPQFSAMGSFPDNGIPADSTHLLQTQYPFSLAISETGDKLYYCFTQIETNNQTMDALCTVGRRNPTTGQWSWDAPLNIGPKEDGRDQFDPELAVTRESSTYSTTGETASVTFYTRGGDPNNHLYRAARTVSGDGGLSYYPAQDLFGGADADPAQLPIHCLHSSIRFIGDYAGIEGYSLHAQSLSFMSFNPGAVETTTLANYSSLGHWNQ